LAADLTGGYVDVPVAGELLGGGVIRRRWPVLAFVRARAY
jgi:hypothetical protein